MRRQVEKNVFSQFGEDGVIEFILSKLPLTDNWCCEFGAWDGKYLSNTYNLVKNKNYNSVYIEGDESKFLDLLKTSEGENNRITPIKQWVGINGEESLDNILSKTNIPKNFDVLSIDVDGTDYCIWDNFNTYRPKLVIIEINSSFNPELILTEEELKYETMLSRSGTEICGVNFKTCYELGKSKGYKLFTHTGNMFFIDEEYESYFDDLANDENYLTFFKTNWFLTSKIERPG